LGGIGFESPGIHTVVDGNGADSGFVNVETYGDPAAYLATDLPGMQAYNLGLSPDPGVVPWLGATMGPVEAGWGDMKIPERAGGFGGGDADHALTLNRYV
jgi:hypothetical protein